MDEITRYKGYTIYLCIDDTFDVFKGLEFFDSDFKTIKEAKEYIDNQE